MLLPQHAKVFAEGDKFKHSLNQSIVDRTFESVLLNA